MEEELVEQLEDFMADVYHERVVDHLPNGAEVAIEELVANMDTGFRGRRRHGIQRLPLGQCSRSLIYRQTDATNDQS
jgi:hypothetical protein